MIFNSNCLKYVPLIVFEHLTCLIKSFLVHAHVSNIILLTTLIPIPKDKLGDLSSSNNYRSKAISSLILKIFDWIIILLFEESLGLDDLQFSYQKNCSTTMCTWMVIEGISYFIRNGSEVFTCTMDPTKAFDMVRHSALFGKMMNQKFSAIFTRLLKRMYTLQYADVCWNGKRSRRFKMNNGVKQGAVLSVILIAYHKIPIISAGLILFRKPFLGGLFSGGGLIIGMIFVLRIRGAYFRGGGGAYYRDFTVYMNDLYKQLRDAGLMVILSE